MTAPDLKTIVIARSADKPHASGAAGDWYVAYQVVREYDLWHLEMRYCHTVDESACDVHDGQWRVMTKPFETPFDACTEFLGDSGFGKATSQHTLHYLVLEYNSLQMLIGELEAMLTEEHVAYRLNEVKRISHDDFEAQLKSRRLWSAAQRGDAPQDKVDAIRSEIEAAFAVKVTSMQAANVLRQQALDAMQRTQRAVAAVAMEIKS